MADDAVEFASLLCSRLCHDLLSPVGSFGNGLELLADEQEPEMQKRCIDLLESSATTAINKLKFFRLAFGSAGGYGESIAPADIRDAITGFVPAGRETALRWLGDEAPVPKLAARTGLLLAMVIVDALVRGGTIDLAMEKRDNMLELAVRGAGPRIVLDPVVEAAFSGAEGELSPKTVGVALARRMVRSAGGEIMLSRPADTELLVGAIIPL